MKKKVTDRTPCSATTEEQAEAAYRRFVALVKKAESHHQMQRIEARIEFPGFIKEHGREQCDAWFERLKKEEPLI